MTSPWAILVSPVQHPSFGTGTVTHSMVACSHPAAASNSLAFSVATSVSPTWSFPSHDGIGAPRRDARLAEAPVRLPRAMT